LHRAQFPALIVLADSQSKRRLGRLVDKDSKSLVTADRANQRQLRTFDARQFWRRRCRWRRWCRYYRSRRTARRREDRPLARRRQFEKRNFPQWIGTERALGHGRLGFRG